MVIFHSYVSLPEGTASFFVYVLIRFQWPIHRMILLAMEPTPKSHLPGLVNLQKTMENHHF